MGEKRSIICCCTHDQRINFEEFAQNGCYGNQPQPFEVEFYCIDANTSCSFSKQDLTINHASFCFVPCKERKFLKLTLVFSAFRRGFLEILYHTHWAKYHLTEAEILHFFLVYWMTTLLVFDKFQEFYSNILRSRNVGVKSVGTKK